jgi:hypothetical protein
LKVGHLRLVETIYELSSSASPPASLAGTARSAAGLFDTRVCPAAGCQNDHPCREHPHASPHSGGAHLYAALALISVGRLDAASPKLGEAVGRHPMFCVYEPERVLELIRATARSQDILYRRLAAKGLGRTEAELWLAELRSALAGDLPETERHDPTSLRRASLAARCRELSPALARELLLNPTGPRPELLVEHEQEHALTRAQADDDWRRVKTSLLEHRAIDLLGPEARNVLERDEHALARDR